ncbi:hypothetical protein HDA32_005823 [Spinactinospora alkalitolerans]|uniref:Uncharacterized protein n=1 Tax=Spinactinospora alkalitolerans TaxID=687207 RepID=A0A852U751_9ACTN|nr:hypothetical protein [Spinactinospora alkalitolerans]
MATEIASRYRVSLREVAACCEPTVEAALEFREGRRR